MNNSTPTPKKITLEDIAQRKQLFWVVQPLVQPWVFYSLLKKEKILVTKSQRFFAKKVSS